MTAKDPTKPSTTKPNTIKYNNLIQALHKYEESHNLRKIVICTDHVIITCCTHTYRLTWDELAAYL